MDYEAQSWLDMTRSGGGVFDEIQDLDSEDYTPRDVPMTTPRHAAVAAISYLNARFDLSAGLEGDYGVRADIVDTVTAIINQSVGEGPFGLEAAATLNQIHGKGENTYRLEYVAEDQKFEVTIPMEHHPVETSSRLLLEAATRALDGLDQVKSPK